MTVVFYVNVFLVLVARVGKYYLFRWYGTGLLVLE